MTTLQRIFISGMFALAVSLTASQGAESTDFPIRITLSDGAAGSSHPRHTYPENQTFSVQVTLSSSQSVNLTYQWRDFRGTALTSPVTISSNQSLTITSPSKTSGYYGLVFTPPANAILPNKRVAGEELEYGFAILPSYSRTVHADSPFGLVHAYDFEDPYLPAWIKTTTWQTYAVGYWQTAIQERRSKGLLELPMISGDVWETDDTAPVSQSQLTELVDQAQAYFAADPTVLYWELGLEENLSDDFDATYYWSNLAAKASAVERAKNGVNASIQLIYQVEGTSTGNVEKFLRSEAAKSFKILSLHPYKWPDFPEPETWLPGYLNDVQTLMDRLEVYKPIWLTEVGAPHQGAPVGSYFGYGNYLVTGKTRHDAVRYLIKSHVLAMANGAQKVFWYNYLDQGEDRSFPEHHFGLFDFWGYPKPVYPAYATMNRLLQNTVYQEKLPLTVQAYRFSGGGKAVWVLWWATSTTVALADLEPNANPDDITVYDSVGTLSQGTPTLQVGPDPIFVVWP